MVFIESSILRKHLPEYLADDDFHALQLFLTDNPEAGQVIRGSGGLRKLPQVAALRKMVEAWSR